MTVIRRLAVVVALGIGVGGLAPCPRPSLTLRTSQTYVVAEGDTLIGIASKSGIRLSELLRSNNLTAHQPDSCRAKSSTFPRLTGGPASSSQHTDLVTGRARSAATYGVRWGDTLSRNRQAPPGFAGIARRSQPNVNHQPDHARHADSVSRAASPAPRHHHRHHRQQRRRSRQAIRVRPTWCGLATR